jgi:vitamin B12 transporter
LPLSGHFRELFERFIHRQIVTTVFKNSGFHFHTSIRSFLLFSVLCCSSVAMADELQTDSLHNKSLNEVVVNGQKIQTARAALPVQIISEKELSSLNASNVADAAKHFAGVSVKDYGGIGGLKTVSIRGLGAQHTGVSYDGVMLSDVQTGQIDLSRYSLENVSEVSVSNGQPNNIFQTARMFSYSGVLGISTKEAPYNPLKTFETKVTAKTGSFGVVNLSVLLAKNFNKKLTINVSADALTANGKYKFTQYYGNLSNQSEILTRTNADVTSIRSEVNATYHINNKELISLKSNYLSSERGLPANIFYNGYSDQRLKEKQFFSQLHYLNKNSISFQQQFFVKYNRSYIHYTDMSSNSEYTQNEYYSSYSAIYQPFYGLSTSVSTDWWLTNLDAKSIYNNDFGHPTRNTELLNVAAKYSSERFIISGNVLGTFTQEQVQSGSASPDRHKITPSISLSYQLLSDESLHIRAFYKDIFRVPTFNDLYYQDLGNTNLKPESTQQYNLGIVYQLNKLLFLNNLEISVDGYYNHITDKIIAIPKDLFLWTMVNKGSVEIKGIDINFKSGIKLHQTNEMLVRLNYTYNKATDKTIDSPNYGEQIPYTPFTSGSGTLSYKNKLGETGYNILYSGLRWKGPNNSDNLLSAYAEHSIYVSTQIMKIHIKAEIINLFNTQYEIVKFYPMPGRNFRFTLSTII